MVGILFLFPPFISRARAFRSASLYRLSSRPRRVLGSLPFQEALLDFPFLDDFVFGGEKAPEIPGTDSTSPGTFDVRMSKAVKSPLSYNKCITNYQASLIYQYLHRL